MLQVIITFETSITCNIDLQLIKNYLLNTGWEDDGPWMRYGRLYKKGEDKIGLINEDAPPLGDFNLRMNEFFHELAKYEQISIPEIMNCIGLAVY